MPSIPQSLLWISLVVLWLFVLVPMLINKRDTVRRTSDVALATRVLNGGVRSRLIKRSGPAAGHRHDPDWQAAAPFVEDYPDLYDEAPAEAGDLADQRDLIQEYDDAVREARTGARSRSVMVVAAVSEQFLAEPDYLDVDIVEDSSGALPVGGTGVQASLFDAPQPAPAKSAPVESAPVEPAPLVAEPAPDAAVSEPVADVVAQPQAELAEPVAEPVGTVAAPDGTADEYEYIDDTSGLETEEGPLAPAPPRQSNRQRRLTNAAATAVSARKYRFRKRVLILMAALMVLSATLSFTVSPTLWWAFAAIAGVTVLYLAYLRRQTRIEAQVRRRRQQRVGRSRPMAEPAFGAMSGAMAGGMADERFSPGGPEVDFSEFPTRLQRPGTAVLEIDDEDPIFEHLDEVQYSRRHYGMSRSVSPDLPRAAGQ